MAITSGSYTATYNALDLGYTADGYRMECISGRKAVTVDSFGDMEIDGVQRGVNCFLEMILKEWQDDVSGSEGRAQLMWPYSSNYMGALETIGHLEVVSSMAKALVMTVTAGTPAATTGPSTITFPKSILEAEFARTVNFNNEDRSMPVRMRNYPSTITYGVSDNLTGLFELS